MSNIGTARIVIELPFELKDRLQKIVDQDNTTDVSKTLRGLIHDFVEKNKTPAENKTTIRRRKRN